MLAVFLFLFIFLFQFIPNIISSFPLPLVVFLTLLSEVLPTFIHIWFPEVYSFLSLFPLKAYVLLFTKDWKFDLKIVFKVHSFEFHDVWLSFHENLKFCLISIIRRLQEFPTILVFNRQAWSLYLFKTFWYVTFWFAPLKCAFGLILPSFHFESHSIMFD